MNFSFGHNYVSFQTVMLERIISSGSRIKLDLESVIFASFFNGVDEFSLYLSPSAAMRACPMCRMP
jgi:hypothetical protein